MFKRIAQFFIIAGLCSTAISSVRAEEKVGSTNLWKTTASAGLTLTSGNSDTVLATAKIETVRKWEKQDLTLGAGAAYGENSKIKNVENLQLFGQYNRSYSERVYFGMKVDYIHDDIADVDYRFTLSPLLGYYLVKNEKTMLAVEAGPSLVFEKQGGVTQSFIGARIGERFEYKINARARVWQKAEFIPQIDDLNNYLINAEVGIDTAITEQVSLRAVLQDIYDNVPALGRQKNDVRLVTGIAYKF